MIGYGTCSTCGVRPMRTGPECFQCAHGEGAIRSAVLLFADEVTDFAARRYASERKRYGPLTVVLDVDGRVAIVSDYAKMRAKLGRQPRIDECGSTSLRMRDVRPENPIRQVYGEYAET